MRVRFKKLMKERFLNRIWVKRYVCPHCDVYFFESEQHLAGSGPKNVGFDVSVIPPDEDDDDTDLVGETRKHSSGRNLWSD